MSAGTPPWCDHDHRLGARRCSTGSIVSAVRLPRGEVDVGEDRRGARRSDRVGGGDERERRDDRPRRPGRRRATTSARCRAVVQLDTATPWPAPTDGGERLLEGGDPRALGHPAGARPRRPRPRPPRVRGTGFITGIVTAGPLGRSSSSPSTRCQRCRPASQLCSVASVRRAAHELRCAGPGELPSTRSAKSAGELRGHDQRRVDPAHGRKVGATAARPAARYSSVFSGKLARLNVLWV